VQGSVKNLNEHQGVGTVLTWQHLYKIILRKGVARHLAASGQVKLSPYGEFLTAGINEDVASQSSLSRKIQQEIQQDDIRITCPTVRSWIHQRYLCQQALSKQKDKVDRLWGAPELMACLFSCLVVLVGTVGIGEASPPGRTEKPEPLVIQIEAGHLQMTPIDQGSVFRSTAPFRVHAGSILPRWRIVAIMGPISEPSGANSGRHLRPPQVSLKPAHALDNPGKSWTGSDLLIEGSSIIALGGPTSGRIHEINAFDLVVDVDPLSAPGQYQGSLMIVPEIPGASPLQGDEVYFEWNIVELLSVDTQTDLMDFGMAGVGATDCLNPAVFMVYSNHYEAEIMVSMEPLTGVDNGVTLAPEVSTIGWGFDPAAARQNTMSAPFGQNDLRIVLGPGEHKIAVHARLQLSSGEPAGRYSGRIVITSRVIN
jgi:hypothetical protein